MALDSKDKIILSALMQNCRMPVKEIAKKAHLTHPAVLYRIKKLETQNYILKYDALINLNLFESFTSIFFVYVPKSRQKSFEKYCKKNASILSVGKHISKFNYSITAILSEKERQIVEDYLKKRKLEYSAFTAKKISFGNFAIFQDVEIPLIDKTPVGKKLKLDKTDAKLISILSDGGGRDSILELARKTRLSADLVLYRFRKLNKAGYFVIYLAQPNLEKFHVKYEIINIKIKDIKFDECFKILNKTKRLSFFAHDGKENFVATLVIQDLEDFEKTLDKIRTEIDNKLMELDIYPVKDWLFLNRLNLDKVLTAKEKK